MSGPTSGNARDEEAAQNHSTRQADAIPFDNHGMRQMSVGKCKELGNTKTDMMFDRDSLLMSSGTSVADRQGRIGALLRRNNLDEYRESE